MLTSITDFELEKYSLAIAKSQSTFMLDNFVDGGQLTIYRNFRQCVLELKEARNTLFNIRTDKMLLDVKIEECNAKLRNIEIKMRNNTTDKLTFKKRKIAIKMQKLQHRHKNLCIAETGVMQTIEAHESNLIKYREKCGIDKNMTSAEINAVLEEKESEYFQTKLVLDLLVARKAAEYGVSQGVLLAIANLPDDAIASICTATGIPDMRGAVGMIQNELLLSKDS